jgi:O-antigen/teichoic acid export membrane protein
MNHAPNGGPVPIEPPTGHPPALVRRLVRGGVWVSVGRIAGIGLTFLSNVVLARWLSPGEFGQFLMVVSVIGFLTILARFGLDRILVRFLSEGLGTGDGMLVKRALRISFSVGLASSLLVSVVTIVILECFSDALEVSGTLIFLVGGAVPLFTILFLVAESFRGFHQLSYASLFQTHSGPVTTLGFVGFLCFLVFATASRPSLFLALMCYILPAAFILPLAFIFLSRTIKRYLPTEKHATQHSSTPLSLSRTFSVCAPSAISDTSSFMAANAGLWIAAVCCSQDDVALFGTARQLAMLAALPLNLVNTTVVSSIPELYTQGNLAKLQRMLQIAATVALIPTAMLVLAFVIWPAPILNAAFGSFYRDAAPILIVLSLGRLVSAWTGSCLNVLLFTGWHNVVAVMNVLLVVALLVLGLIFGRAYGLMGIALVSAAVALAINLTAWALAKTNVGVWTHATFRVSGWNRSVY